MKLCVFSIILICIHLNSNLIEANAVPVELLAVPLGDLRQGCLQFLKVSDFEAEPRTLREDKPARHQTEQLANDADQVKVDPVRTDLPEVDRAEERHDRFEHLPARARVHLQSHWHELDEVVVADTDAN